MQKYEIELAAPSGPHTRLLSVEAPSEQAARDIAEQKELALVEFSLLPPDREYWEEPPGGPNDKDGLVDLSRWDAFDRKFAVDAAKGSYDDAVKVAKERLALFEQQSDIKNGKLLGTRLSARQASRLLAHKQQEPYSINSVRVVDQRDIDARRLARELVQLKADTMHDPEQWRRILDRMREAGVSLNAVTAALYGLPWQNQINGSSVTVYSSAAIQCSLHTAYTANFDVDDFFNDVSATEISGTGYTTLGVSLASKTSTYDTASDQIRLDAADVSWTTSTLSATDAVLWVNTAGASTTDMLWGNVDFGATVTTTAGTFQITWDATGIFVFDVT